MIIEVIYVVNETTCTDAFQADPSSSQMWYDGRAILKFKNGQGVDGQGGLPGRKVRSAQYHQAERIIHYEE